MGAGCCGAGPEARANGLSGGRQARRGRGLDARWCGARPSARTTPRCRRAALRSSALRCAARPRGSARRSPAARGRPRPTPPLTLLLPRRVPHVEDDLALVRVELHRMHLRAYRRDVLLLELARLVALDECRLADAAVAHEHELEFGHGSGRLSGRGGEGGEGTVRRREKGEGPGSDKRAGPSARTGASQGGSRSSPF